MNRRWRERHPDYFKNWRQRLSPERVEELRVKKAEAHRRRRAGALADDAEGRRAREAEYQRQWSAANKERVRERRKAYYRANAERLRARAREWSRAHPEYTRDRYLRRLYGVTLADFTALLEAQGDRCAICRQPETTMLRGRVKALHVDHDHRTGRVRGLLCFRCNAMLGHVAEDPEVFQAAIDYLRS